MEKLIFKIAKIADNLEKVTAKDLKHYSITINKLQIKKSNQFFEFFKPILQKKLYGLILFFGISKCFCQDTLVVQTHSQIFSLSPISKRVDKVNGIVIGVGHYENLHIQKQTINGINIEANPMGFAAPFFVFYLPQIIKNNKNNSANKKVEIVHFNIEKPALQINGINISTGCFMTKTNLNGFSFSLFNKINNLNGFIISGLGVHANCLNGISIGIYNGTNTLNGTSLGLFNETLTLNGLQFGLYNFSGANKGLQIGVFNMSKSKGLQIGLWNINGKRSLPLINW